MRRAFMAALATTAAGLLAVAAPAYALDRYYQVGGVAADDMLKLRAGPGVGFKVIAGLPNGTVLRVFSCEQTGGTRWCKVALKQAPGLKGYVSWAYLREM